MRFEKEFRCCNTDSTGLMHNSLMSSSTCLLSFSDFVFFFFSLDACSSVADATLWIKLKGLKQPTRLWFCVSHPLTFLWLTQNVLLFIIRHEHKLFLSFFPDACCFSFPFCPFVSFSASMRARPSPTTAWSNWRTWRSFAISTPAFASVCRTTRYCGWRRTYATVFMCIFHIHISHNCSLRLECRFSRILGSSLSPVS